MSRLRLRRDETGSALVEFTWLAIILLIPLVWIVMSVFEVQRGAFAVSAAARTAGRAFALAEDDATGRQRAEAAVAQVLADQGAKGQRGSVEVRCEPDPANCHTGTSVITVTVDSQVVLPLAPEIFGREIAIFRLDASHTVPIGQYVETGGAEAEGER